jgi:sugar O-acyltransferase (sialic acid O-acetyltransferase NeuD family)
MRRPVLLVGTSALGRDVAEAVRASGREVLGCVSDQAPAAAEVRPVRDGSVPLLGGLDAVLSHSEAGIVLCAEPGAVRARLHGRLAGLGVEDNRYAVVVHPSVYQPPSCVVGRGSVVLAGVVLATGVTIGEHVMCMASVTISHDDVIGSYATLCPGATLAADVRIGEFAQVGPGAVVGRGVVVGDGAVLGVGAAVSHDVAEGRMVTGRRPADGAGR